MHELEITSPPKKKSLHKINSFQVNDGPLIWSLWELKYESATLNFPLETKTPNQSCIVQQAIKVQWPGSQYSHNSCSCFKPCACSLPFFLVATGCHDCPVEIYPQERGLPNCRSSGNACNALACSGPYWAYGADLGCRSALLGSRVWICGSC